ncbi:MAG: HIT family protein [Candidatus Absconditabacterales bacterium]
MKYITVVKKLEKIHTCPFCHEKPENMLQEGKYFFVIPARAPYTKHHILVIPKRHVNLLATLSHAEILEMNKLVDIRAKKLHTKYKDVSLLLRDGLVKDRSINKSINHLHFHLLPNIGVHVQSNKEANNRQWTEDKEYAKMTQTYKKTFL